MCRKEAQMNSKVMFSSKTDMWATPQGFFDELDREFHFELDVCAAPENAKCRSKSDNWLYFFLWFD